jgi:predicted PurR-regulated permease PerM
MAATPSSAPSRSASATPSARAIAKIFYTVLALALSIYVLYLVRNTLLTLAIALFLAVALGPAVDTFSRRGVPRWLSILLVYFLIFLAIFGVGLLIVPPIASQVQGLANDIPGYLKDLRKNPQFRKYDNKYKITKKLNEQARKLPSKLGDAAGALRDVTVGVFSAAIKLVTVLTIVFFMLLEGERLVNFVFRLMGPDRAPRYRRVARDIYGAVSGYVAGNLLISIVAGTVTYITLSVLGVPFAVPLAVLMAFLDLIPLVGATIGGVVIGIVTLFTDFPLATIVWVIVLIVYQQVENNVVQPIVYRRTVNVPPLAVIVAILIGSELLGVLGALVAIPIAATVQIVVRDIWNLHGGPNVPAEPGPPPPQPEPPPRPGPEAPAPAT